MKIIRISSKNRYRENIYDMLDGFLEFGMNYLPFIFLRKVYMDGLPLQLPRWLTQRRMDEIDKRTQELMNKINWE